MARNKRDTASRKRKLAESRAGGNAKRPRHDAQQTPTQLYTAEDDVLVLGDGDFSYSRGLVKHHGTGRGLLATSFDSESQVHSKYPNAQECIAAVKTGTGMVAVPDFFKFIVFNFPHSGQQRVHINRALLVNFFESARDRLTVHGEAHVTLKTKPPYSNWFIEDQAKAAGFVLKERRKFNIRLFPGYRHRTTDPQAKKFEPDLCVTYVFVVNRSKYPFQNSRAALSAASAKMSAAEASEQLDLAAAIVNIAKTNAANKLKKDTGNDGAKSVAKSPDNRSHATPVVVRPDTKDKQARPAAHSNVNHQELWKPLHRRSGSAFF
ncbi:hypothetical protein PF011_g12542 [Phytophthora fragariae]|nr:hypothetical protein PF011_g12542 [Phytophthora fragariae]